jgi:hypothetical protein
MKLSELKRVGFEATASTLKTTWMGRPCVKFGSISYGSGAPHTLDQDQFARAIGDLIERYGDVQVGTEHILDTVYLVPNCPRYKEAMSPRKAEEFREYLNNQLKTTE